MSATSGKRIDYAFKCFLSLGKRLGLPSSLFRRSRHRMVLAFFGVSVWLRDRAEWPRWRLMRRDGSLGELRLPWLTVLVSLDRRYWL